MPVPLSPEEAQQFHASDAAPAAFLDLLDAVSFRSVGAGLRLGVFEALASGPLPVERLAPVPAPTRSACGSSSTR